MKPGIFLVSRNIYGFQKSPSVVPFTEISLSPFVGSRQRQNSCKFIWKSIFRTGKTEFHTGSFGIPDMKFVPKHVPLFPIRASFCQPTLMDCLLPWRRMSISTVCQQRSGI